MHPQPGRSRRWLVAPAVVVAVGVLAGVVVALSHDDRVPGRPTGGAVAEAEPHKLTKIADIETTGYPKDEGIPSPPDEGTLEIHGDLGYVATLTGKAVHVTAFRLADGSTVWRQDVPLNPPPAGFAMVVTAGVLLVQVLYGGAYRDNIAAHDLKTGEILWTETGSLSEVAANRMLTYDEQADTVGVEDLADGKQLWSTNGDRGRTSEFPSRRRSH